VTYQTLLVIHFILPFLVVGLIVFHLNALHYTGRRNPYYNHSGLDKVSFYPSYWLKDRINLIVYILLVGLMFIYPYTIGESELYEEANRINSPVHICPEWYFCAQYCILRSVPNKGVGVILMIMRIVILFVYPLSIGYMTPPTSLRWLVWVVAVFSQV